MSKTLTKLAPFIVVFFLGIVLALTFRFFKYSEFINPSIVDINPAVAYEQILKNPEKIILIDVRSEYEYSQAHASSSVNLPIHHMYDDTHGIPNEKNIPLPKNKDKEIYLLCTGGRLAGVAYSYLEHYGYRNIKRIEGGLKGWNDNKLPIVTKNLFQTSATELINNKTYLDRPYVPK